MRRLLGRRRAAAYPVLDVTPATVLMALGVAASMLLSVGAGLLVSRVIDLLAAGTSMEDALVWLLAALAVALAAALANLVCARWLPVRLGLVRATRAVKHAAADVLGSSQRAYAQRDKGFYVNVLTNSTSTYGTLSANVSMSLVGSALGLACLVGVAAWLNVGFAALLVAYVPIFWLALRLPVRRLAWLQREAMPTQDAYLGESKRVVEERRAIVASAACEFFSARYQERSRAYLAFIIRYRFNELLITSLPQMLSGVLAVALMAVALAQAQSRGPGLVFVAYQLASLVQAPLITLFQLATQARALQPHVDRLRELAAAAAEPSGFEGLYR